MIKFKEVSDIEAEIQRLEDEIAHSSLSLNEEKKVMESIRQLKNSKAVVSEYSVKMENLAVDETTCKEINAAIKALDMEINAIRKEEDEHRAALNAERKKEEASGMDNQSLWNEKEKCREACKEAYEKIKDMRASHDLQWQEFKAQEKVWRAQQAADKAKKREQYLQEKAIREAERAARDKEMAPEPFSEEIVTCDQLTGYLSKFIGGSEDSGADVDTSGDKPALDGMQVFSKKEDPEMAWMTGNGGKKKGKKTKAAAQGSSEKLVHTVDILSAFASLKLSVPLTKGDCSDVLKKVSEKKEDFMKKREEAKEGGEVETPTEVADASNASTEPGAGTSKESQKGNKKKSKPATLKLDDESSWPSMGGMTTDATKSVAPAVNASAADEEEPLEEGEILPTPKENKSDPVPKEKGDAIAVSIEVNGNTCSVHLN
jgi:hypothetical protein